MEGQTMTVAAAYRKPDRKVPDCDQLKRLVARDMTDQQIADWTLEHLGNKVTRTGIVKARERCGVASARERARYVDEIPWRLPDDLQGHPWVKLLRLWGRENAGKSLSRDERGQLAKFKRELEAMDASVHYDPDHPQRLLLVTPRRPGETLVRKPD